MCSTVAQVLRLCVTFNQRLDTFSFLFQTLVIKVSGVILSVVGGLAVGKVMEPEERCFGLIPSILHVLRTRLMGAVLCFPGGANDSLRLRDCRWGFPGEVHIAEARFQGESSPDADVNNNGDHECPPESRVPPAPCRCARRPSLTSNPRVSTVFCPGWFSWGLPRGSAQSLILSGLCGCAFFCRHGLLKGLYALERSQE